MSLVIKRLKNNPVDSNCFVLYDKAVGNQCIVIDPGFEDSSLISTFFNKENITPEYIILTHEHFDHCWGCIDLEKLYHVPVICSEKCGERIGNAKGNLSLFYNNIGFSCHNKVITIESVNNHLVWNGVAINFYSTPGHTDSGISFIINDHLFTGDTLIKDLKTVTKLKCGSKDDLKLSINFYSSLKGKGIQVHPGHGEEFALDTYVLEIAKG